MQKKTGNLGRGLGALLSQEHEMEYGMAENQNLGSQTDTNTQSHGYSEHLNSVSEHFGRQRTLSGGISANSLIEIPISHLVPMKDQPRQHFSEDTLQELSGSLAIHGILQPLIVADIGNGQFKIIAGERRWRAAGIAGLETVPCLVRDVSKQVEMEIALIENIQREELSSIDEAKALKRLMDEHSYTQEGLALKIGKDRTTVTNALRLLNLPQEIIDDLQSKILSAGHARCLCSLDDKKIILKARDSIVSRKLSVRQTEDLVKNLKKEKKDAPVLKDQLPPDIRHLCDQFKGHLGTKVKIAGGIDKGKIEISYYTLEDLERIADLVLGSPLNVQREN